MGRGEGGERERIFKEMTHQRSREYVQVRRARSDEFFQVSSSPRCLEPRGEERSDRCLQLLHHGRRVHRPVGSAKLGLLDTAVAGWRGGGIDCRVRDEWGREVGWVRSICISQKKEKRRRTSVARTRGAGETLQIPFPPLPSDRRRLGARQAPLPAKPRWQTNRQCGSSGSRCCCRC